MTTTGTPDSGNGSIAEAASAFEKILAGKSVNQDDRDDAKEDPALDDEAEALEASSDEEETPSDEEGAEDEEATADDEEAEEDEEQPAERMITVKIDGKDMAIPESEAARGYQRQADYSRHMAALQQHRQEVQAERAQYAELLPAVIQQLQMMQPQEPDWERLYNEDPLEYVRQKELSREREQQLIASQAELQRINYLQEQEAAAELQQRVQMGRQDLQAYNPAWQDKATWEKDRVQLREYGKAQGFSEEEISKAYDPRSVRLLHKAYLYDRLMSKKPKPVRQQSPMPTRGGASQAQPSRKHSDISKAKMRLAKTGSVRDAAKVFEGLL
jgi:hypothetical protein